MGKWGKIDEGVRIEEKRESNEAEKGKENVKQE